MTNEEIKMKCLEIAVSAGYRDPVSAASAFIDYVSGSSPVVTSERSDPLSPDVLAIITEAATMHGATVYDILGPRRSARIVAARDDAIAAVYIAYPSYGLCDLGKIFNRDHTSILASLRRSGNWKPRELRAA